MEIVDKIKSIRDDVTKYVLRLDDGLITEFSYINKDDGKDIICVSTQTLCVQGCKFCHVTDHIGKLKFRNLRGDEMWGGVSAIISDLGMQHLDVKRNCLLISFMGCGEPLDNINNVCGSMGMINTFYHGSFKVVRFAIATMLPKNRLNKFFELVSYVKDNDIMLKLHLSLHYTFEEERQKWMPNATSIPLSIDCFKWAEEYCGLALELHYALIDGVNDSHWDFHKLKQIGLPVKFLYYNEKDTVDAEPSQAKKYTEAEKILKEAMIPCEYYVPPGLDVGASCGQFLLDYYQKYNGVTNEQY